MRKILPYILLAVIVLSAFLPIGFGGTKKAEAAVALRITASNVVSNYASFGMIVNANVAEITNGNFGLAVYDSYNPSNNNFGSPYTTVTPIQLQQTAGQQTLGVVLSKQLTANKLYYARAQYTDASLVTTYSNVISFKFGDPNSVNANFQNSDTAIIPTATGVGGGIIDQLQNAPEQNKANEDILPSCGLISSGSSIYGCVIQVVYYLFWVPTSWLAGLAAKFLDFFVFYSIQSSSYSGSTFVTQGWGVVRDLSNIAFIFVLIFAAIKTILDLGGSDKLIKNVIIIALLINFSLFFTKAIVDAGNILAGVLYNDIGVTILNQNGGVVESEKGETQVSSALVAKFNPQNIIASAGVTNENVNEDSIKTPYLVVIILATIINLVMIYVFCSVAFLFVGRVVGLMLAMIFSPFAFISRALPDGDKALKDWGWSNWWGNLTSLTALAPIFIFLLWLIIKFLDTGLLTGIGDKLKLEGNTFGNFVNVILPFALIMFMLIEAKSIAQTYAGKIGNTINQYAGAVAGFVGGAAIGGAALVGRSTLGRLGASLATSRGGEGGPTGTGGDEGITRPPIQPLSPVTPGRVPFKPIPRRPIAGPLTLERPEREDLGPAVLFQRPGVDTVPSVRNTAGTILRMQEERRRRKEEEELKARAERSGIQIAGRNAPIPAGPAPIFPTAPTGAIRQAPAQSPETETFTSPESKIYTTAPIQPKQQTIKVETQPTQKQTEALTGEKKPEETKTADQTLAGDIAAKSAIEKTREEEKAKAEEKKASETRSLKDMAAAAPKTVFGIRSVEDVKNTLGKKGLDIAKYLGSSSFDLRDSKWFNYMMKKASWDLGKASGKGGYEAKQKEILKNEEEFAKSLVASGKELETLNQLKLDLAKMTNDEQLADIKKRKKELKQLKIDLAEEKNEEKIAKIKEKIEKQTFNKDEEKIFDFSKTVDEEDKRIKDLNKTRQTAYAERIEKGTFFSYKPTDLESANKIRGLSKSKSEKDKMYEAAKKLFEEEKPKNEKPEEDKPKEDKPKEDKDKKNN